MEDAGSPAINIYCNVSKFIVPKAKNSFMSQLSHLYIFTDGECHDPFIAFLQIGFSKFYKVSPQIASNPLGCCPQVWYHVLAQLS